MPDFEQTVRRARRNSQRLNTLAGRLQHIANRDIKIELDSAAIDDIAQVVQIQRWFKKRRERRLVECRPTRYRASRPGAPVARPADFGAVVFSGREQPLPADFLHLADSRSPWISDEAYAVRTADMMRLHWGLPSSHALISVVGYGPDSGYALTPPLLAAVSEGLARAAVANKACVLTNGLTGGVASLVGKALAEYDARHKGTQLGVHVHLIGVAPWGAVLENLALTGCRGGDVHLGACSSAEDDPGCAQLDKHHSHFLLVEADETLRGRAALGSELAFRGWLEESIVLEPRAADARGHTPTPRFMLVVHGEQRALHAIVEALGAGVFVVLVTEAGGVATLIDEAVNHDRLPTGASASAAAAAAAAAAVNTPVNAAVNTTTPVRRSNGRGGAMLNGSSKEEDAYPQEFVPSPRPQATGNHDDDEEEDVTRSLLRIAKLAAHGARLSFWRNDGTQTLDAHMLHCVLRTAQTPWQAPGSAPAAAAAAAAAAEPRGSGGRPSPLSRASHTTTKSISRSMKNLQATLQLTSPFTRAHRSHEWSLACAVGWDQLEMLARMLQEERHSDGALALALQVAISTFRIGHVRLLISARPSLAHAVDLVGLYSCEHPLLLSDATLHKALRFQDVPSGRTSLATYRRVLCPFLSAYVPGIAARLERRRKSKKASIPSLADVMLWAVFLGDRVFAKSVWLLASQEHGEPLRLALLASQVAATISKMSNPVAGCDRRRYAAMAKEFEEIATEILDQCPSEHEAARVLLCKSASNWPNSVLRLAVDGANKQFVAHRHVQALVNEAWRGFYVGSKWALPRHASSFEMLFGPLAVNSLVPVTPAAVVGLLDDRHDLSEAEQHVAGRLFQRVQGLLAVPRVKFSLFLASYCIYLVLYYMVIAQNNGLPHWSITPLDWLLYVWAFSLLAAELWQLWQNYMSNEEHFASFWNYVDITSPVVVLFVACVHSLAAVQCEDGLEEELLSSNGTTHGTAAPTEDGGDGSGHRPLLMADAASLHFAERFELCPLLVLSRVPLSFNAIPSFLRVLDWLTIWQPLGVLEVILVSMLDNVATFLVLTSITCAGFSATFMGLVPELGTGWNHLDTGLADVASEHHAHLRQLKGGHGSHAAPAAVGSDTSMLDGTDAPRLYWTLSSAPYLPIFALYGDLGVSDLEEIAYKGSALNWWVINWAAIASWVYLFLSSVLLVNLLIAMLSETYTRVKEDADNEWMHRRVRVVDEFCGGNLSIPPPLSLPLTLMNMLRGCAACISKRGGNKPSSRQHKGANGWGDFHPMKDEDEMMAGRMAGRMAEEEEEDDEEEEDEGEPDLLSTTLPDRLLSNMARHPDKVWLYDWCEEKEREQATTAPGAGATTQQQQQQQGQAASEVAAEEALAAAKVAARAEATRAAEMKELRSQMEEMVGRAVETAMRTQAEQMEARLERAMREQMAELTSTVCASTVEQCMRIFSKAQ